MTLAERSVGAMLRRLGFRRLVGAAATSAAGPGGAGDAPKNFADLVKAVIPEHAREKPIELWWQDEARVGQQGTLTRVSAERGSRPPAPREQRHEWAYYSALIGAALVLPYANTQAMNLHLEEISCQVTHGSHAVLLLDGAGWHQTGEKLRVPGNISLLQLPSYSPELNPVENIWRFLRRTVWATASLKATPISLMRVAPHGMLSPLNQSASPQLPHETGHRSLPNAVGSLHEAAASSAFFAFPRLLSWPASMVLYDVQYEAGVNSPGRRWH